MRHYGWRWISSKDGWLPQKNNRLPYPQELQSGPVALPEPEPDHGQEAGPEVQPGQLQVHQPEEGADRAAGLPAQRESGLRL